MSALDLCSPMFCHTILQPRQTIVETGISQQRRDMARRRVSCDTLPRVKAEDGHIVPIVQHDQLLAAELDFLYGRFSLEAQGYANTSLAKYVDLTRPEPSVIGADGK